MNIVMMGTPEFAVPTLSALAKHHNVQAVVTQPDKPKGRGNKMQPSPVKQTALELGIRVLQPERIREEGIAMALRALSADLFVVAAYGQILPQTLLEMPKYGAINVHGSLLPTYRGPAPIHHAVLNGDTRTGVTIMQMDAGLDTGDMLLKAELDIAPEDTTGSLYRKMAELGANTLIRALELLEQGNLVPEAQNPAQASYAGMIDKAMGRVNWHKSAAQIVNLIRGLNPWPCAFTELNSQIFKLWQGAAVSNDSAALPGEIIAVQAEKGFCVKTGAGALWVSELQMTGGKRLSFAEYARGHRDHMFSPGNRLE